MTDYGVGTIVLYETGEVFILDEDRSWVKMIPGGVYRLDSVVESDLSSGKASAIYDSVGGLDKLGEGTVIEVLDDLYTRRENGKWYDGVAYYTDAVLWSIISDAEQVWKKLT